MNGVEPTNIHKKYIGFVLQDDILYPSLTVRETLTFSALLRLPKSYSREMKLQKVDEVIKLLNLEKVADSYIGNSASHLYKR
jgi:ABC-type multidrug transport system ATPase subunit